MAVVTGELIRAMNYVEDITATLRRICIYIPGMGADERKRLAESLREAGGAINAAIADLEFLLIGEKTTVSEFKKELRWNEVYHALNRGWAV